MEYYDISKNPMKSKTNLALLHVNGGIHQNVVKISFLLFYT